VFHVFVDFANKNYVPFHDISKHVPLGAAHGQEVKVLKARAQFARSHDIFFVILVPGCSNFNHSATPSQNKHLA
jgi:hypothetical protein